MNRPSRQQVFAAGERLALALQYDGSDYHGWQQQRDPVMPSVQDQLEQALAAIAGNSPGTSTPIKVQCAGRTDRGVHASHQLVHFDAPVTRPETAWVLGVNALLPADIAVKWVRAVPPDFHARFSATARRYRYVIHNTAQRPAHLVGGTTWHTEPLDAELMHREAQCLLGERDFSAFRAAGCQSRSPMRNVHHARVTRLDDLVVLDIQANAFLHHMVRNIAGVLMAVGEGSAPPGWTAQVLAGQDRTRGGITAPAAGLYLVDIDYPKHFALPGEAPGPFFLKGRLR